MPAPSGVVIALRGKAVRESGINRGRQGIAVTTDQRRRAESMAAMAASNVSGFTHTREQRDRVA
jgi:hypothetical protein